MKSIFKFIGSFILIGIGANVVQAQDFSAAAKEKLQAFSFLIGEWEGEAWSYTPEGSKEFSKVTEKIQYDLNETIIVMDGLGVKTESDGSQTIVHEALGILSYQVFDQKYGLKSYISRGMNTDANIELKGPGHIVWSFKAGPVMTIRYTIHIEGETWNEVGERSQDGTTWNQFLEMNLKKMK